MIRPLALAVLLALAPAAAEAHLLRLFVSVEGLTVSGYGFFVGGGGRPQGADVRVRTADGDELTRRTSDEHGSFAWDVPAAGGYVVTMNAGDGHFAEVALGPDRFGPALPQTAVAPRAASPVPEPTGDGTAPPMAPAALEALVERAVARQVRPLAEAQAEADSRIRLRDIAGGLGWIAGLAGLALALRRGRP